MVRKTPVMENLIYQFALFVRSLPAGDDIGAEVINTMPEDLRSIAEPIWREINHLSEEDMKNRFGRGNPNQQNKGQGEQSSGQQQVNRSRQDIERALTTMAALDQKFSVFLGGLLSAEPPGTREIILEAIGRIYKTVPLLTAFLTPLLIRKEREEKVSLLDELVLNPPTSAKPKTEHHGTDATKAFTVLSWLRLADENAFKKIMEIMTSEANDSDKDRPAFYAYLAALHHLQKDEAVANLQAVAAIDDLEARAKMVGVNPNWKTQLKRTFGIHRGKVTQEMVDRARMRADAAVKELMDYRERTRRQREIRKMNRSQYV
ncbi:MAG: hypothetical protein HZC01_03720 [Candidatus Kerfeldbacteria bacterium]|nr:hypothetical protein [Candidatus Kerfeldbacteria bacterium]